MKDTTELKVGKQYICLSNNKEYEIVNITPYKDERSDGWITCIHYKPLYECEIPLFVRSEDMFKTHFREK